MKPNPIYSNSVLVARETLRLDQSRIKRMIAAPDFTEAAKVLLECGYKESSINADEQREDLIILSEHAAAVELFTKLCSDNALLACVLAEYDYHNAKVIFASRLVKTNLSEHLNQLADTAQEATYPFGSIKLTKLGKAIENKEYGNLPSEMQKAFRRLDNMQNHSPAEINRIFEQALSAEIKQNISKIKSAEAKKYFSKVLNSEQRILELKQPSTPDNVFSLDIVWNWFIMKQTELRIVKAILTGKKLKLSREKIRELIRGINDN